jgi:hypothetical protein
MANDSSSGGYLLPGPAPAPLEGSDLLDFIQAWIVGITGIDPTMARPRWQSEPPDIPDSGVAWMSFGITARPSDTYPYVAHGPTGDTLQRHETLEVLCSFYDTGITGLADMYSGLLRDGSAIAQNREALGRAGFALVGVGEIDAVPVIIKSLWEYRVDLAVTLRRQIDRLYPIDDVLSSTAVLRTDDGQPARTINN